MTNLREELLTIKNKEHLKLLKRISVYYKYGKRKGDKLLSSGIDSIIEYKDIADFLEEYKASNEVLLNYFISHGLDLNSSMLEFCPSSFFTLQSTSLIPNITSIVKYQTSYNKYLNEIIGTITKSGIHIQSDFDLELGNYTTILNNSIIDLLKNYNKEENMVNDVHGIKFAEENNLNYYSGFAIKNDSPLRNYVVYDFMKSINKIDSDYETCVFEKQNEYTLGYVKKSDGKLVWKGKIIE